MSEIKEEVVNGEAVVMEGEVVSSSDAQADGANLPVATGQAVVPSGQGIDDTHDAVGLIRWGKVIVASQVFSQFRTPAEVAVAVLAGREQGLRSIESLNSVFFVNGRPTWTANALAGFVKKSRRYDFRVKTRTETTCELVFLQDGQEVGTSVWTLKDAERAGLAGKDVWRKYPRQMLFARALSEGVRVYCPDLIAGGAYTVGELDD